ncbi:UDP-glucose 4-epimerase [Vibrio variabilis]|uniref:UDP-glucose 4-epimerase n=1 Tax=Vibrio variabilis TaxID=990271 RepID=A0ABQ0JQQ5_9VIBR|nr:UDP-glucose 4-epimerase [Vibrio variabilis]
MKVLVTGGMGYIGSHTCVQMLESGIELSSSTTCVTRSQR